MTWKKFSDEKPKVGQFILAKWRTLDYCPWVYTAGKCVMYNWYQLPETRERLCLETYRAFDRDSNYIMLDECYEWQEVPE